MHIHQRKSGEPGRRKLGKALKGGLGQGCVCVGGILSPHLSLLLVKHLTPYRVNTFLLCTYTPIQEQTHDNMSSKFEQISSSLSQSPLPLLREKGRGGRG